MKMTSLNKSETIGEYYIRMEIEYGQSFNYYRVGLYWYGKRITDNIYTLDDRKNALACFRRYVKKAREAA